MMRRRRWICVMAALAVLAGCGGGGTDPRMAFERFKACMVDKKFEDAWDMLSAASQKLVDEHAKTLAEGAAKVSGTGRAAAEDQAKLMDMTLGEMQKMDGKALFVGLYKMAAKKGKEEWDKLPRGKFSRAEVNGDRAKVYVKIDEKEETESFVPMVREGGTWKIDLAGTQIE